MAITFVVVPQWQGSGSARAMRLVDGAEAIRGDLPSAMTRVVDVPLEAGDEQGTGIHRMSSVAVVRDRLAEVLESITGPAVTIGGDCGVELGAIAHVLSGEGAENVAVVWFDAHPDLNTVESSPSGAFGGMVLRTLLGEGPAALVPATPLTTDRVILVGARAFDVSEAEFLDRTSLRSIGVADATAKSVVAAVKKTGARSVYIHVDLDVLDPGAFTGLGYPEPFGMTADTLVKTVKALVAGFELAGAGITEFAPAAASDAVDDLPTILRLVGAFTSGS
ncbi:MAG: arginase family protein [Salinibacterium sp.]|nr:MAG: arginase family protein [Salinibacterium sp.]